MSVGGYYQMTWWTLSGEWVDIIRTVGEHYLVSHYQDSKWSLSREWVDIIR